MQHTSVFAFEKNKNNQVELINEISNTENILGSFCKKFSFKISEVNITEIKIFIDIIL